MTVSRGEGITGKKGKGCQGTCIKDTWTKLKGVRIEGGRVGMGGNGQEGVVVGEMETTVT